MAPVGNVEIQKWSRSILFAAALVFAEIVSTVGSRIVDQTLPTYNVLGHLFWGFASTDVPLAVWLSLRVKRWNDYSSWLRVIAYVAACGYGRMMFYATQDWLADDASGFILPGTTIESFSGAFIYLPIVLCEVILLWPLSRASGLVLVERKDPEEVKSVSIGEIGVWTALLAITIAWIQMLNSDFVIETGYSHSSDLHNLKEFAVYAIQNLVTAGMLVILFLAWSRHWLLAVLALSVGWLFEGLSVGYTHGALTSLLGISNDGILGRDSIGRWLYLGGELLLAFLMSGAAVKLGICVRRIVPGRAEEIASKD